MKKLLSRKGFTMAETLISIVVMLILAGTVSAVMMSGFNIYGRTALRNTAQSIGDSVYELITSRLTYATELTVSDDLMYVNDKYDFKTDDFVCLCVTSEGNRVGIGVKALAPPDIIPPKQFNQLHLRVSAECGENMLLDIGVTITSKEDGRELYSRKGTVFFMNEDLMTDFDVKNCDNSGSDLYFVFNELA